MTKKLKLASVGIEDKQAHALKQLLIIYNKHLNDEWAYAGDFSAQQTIDTMGSQLDCDMTLIDTDSESGRRAWYFLRALNDENSMIAFTASPQQMDTPLVIAKPLTTNIGTLVALLNAFCS